MNSRELFERREELKHVLTELRDELKGIEQQISDTFLEQARNALRADGKDFGTTYIIAGNARLKATVRKKVVWDQDELGVVLQTMPEEDARHYGKMTLAVDERKYTAAPPAVKQSLETCRTVEVGGFSIEEVD
tara:strand:+ start:3365 stop:3763 length:399 start_codon:yes stop_codon:yes gene_type:complete